MLPASDLWTFHFQDQNEAHVIKDVSDTSFGFTIWQNECVVQT